MWLFSRMHHLIRLLPVVVTLTAGFLFVFANSVTLSDEKVESIEDLVDTFNSHPILHEEENDNLWVDDSEEREQTIYLDGIPHPQIVERDILSKNVSKQSSLLLVSTLDGTLSAMNTENEGNILWKVETGPGGLLSSSISKVELKSGGKVVRLIPSLGGGLYKFDGEIIEPIPISADSLLHSSYQASDDLLITGGKEIRTYGIDPFTGHIQYACSTDGCKVKAAEAGSSGDFLVINRHNQIVRAIEPRTGTERWNFSVGRHEASLLHAQSDTLSKCSRDKFESPEKQMECFLNAPSENDYFDEESQIEPFKPSLKFKVVVPDGIICAINPQKPGQIVWKQKFESPIVQVWHLVDSSLTPLNLFDADFIPALESQSEFSENEISASPLLYVGLHKNQLYVQESQEIMEDSSPKSLSLPGKGASISSASRAVQIRWQPLSATSVMPYIQGKPGRFTTSSNLPVEDQDQTNENESCEGLNDSKSTALIVRHQTDYQYDRGFYLFKGKRVLDKKNSQPGRDGKPPTSEEFEEELWEGGRNTPVHIVIVSLWFWWREVVFISLLTAFIFHMVITRQVVNLLQQRWAIELHRHISSIVPPLTRINSRGPGEIPEQTALLDVPSNDVGIEIAQDHAINSVVVAKPTDLVSPTRSSVAPYVSRYQTDFETIQCLGKGGFGVVFEVRNRLDDCHYAVKRIQLPNNEEAREKVMREVKALAKLDNPHIVRYFHAWVECPPPGWQESKDVAWMDSESLTGPTPFNTGEESSIEPNSYADTDLASSDDESKLASLRKPMMDDSSFDVVFEYSSRNQNTSSKQENRSETGLESDSDVPSHAYSSSNVSRSNQNNAVVRRLPSDASKQFRGNSGIMRIPDAKMFLYIQMQLCRKESLREWLRAHVSQRDSNQVLHMFNEIVRAVEYVHLQGLIHRDLKPSNIFFAPDGAIKIGDFGLVTAMAEEAYFHSPMSSDQNPFSSPGFSPFQRTHTDQVGTQMYMSPEQIEGKPYSHKVDIYSLGLILVELLWPLSTQMEQVTVISQLRKLKLPHGFAEKYPEEAILLQKMLSRNPDERPTTFGIRASPPLKAFQESAAEIPEYLHFNFQRPRSTTRTSSSSSS